ncbi:DUF7500 family protein [Haloparvum sp. PAK95]|uniref:DUF7500 family protein n=1 Tax=Haloparvum sp. PAK95 TaxID=3418962 RepID=UPI003D2F3497
MSDDGSAFDPDDLDFSDDERVREIDESRYVVSAGDGAPNPPSSDGTTDADSGDDADATATADESAGPAGNGVRAEDVSRWLTASFRDDGFTYGFDATLSVGDDVVRHRMVSNDVTTTFDTLLTWFSRNVGETTPPAEVLGILFAASNTPVQYPPGTLERYVADHGLSPDDSIADLLEVAEAHGGLRIDDGSATDDDSQR